MPSGVAPRQEACVHTVLRRGLRVRLPQLWRAARAWSEWPPGVVVTSNLNNLRTCVKTANSSPGIVMCSRQDFVVQFSTSSVQAAYDSVKNNISEYVQAHCSGPFPLAAIICRNRPQTAPKTERSELSSQGSCTKSTLRDHTQRKR